MHIERNVRSSARQNQIVVGIKMAFERNPAREDFVAHHPETIHIHRRRVHKSRVWRAIHPAMLATLPVASRIRCPQRRPTSRSPQFWHQTCTILWQYFHNACPPFSHSPFLGFLFFLVYRGRLAWSIQRLSLRLSLQEDETRMFEALMSLCIRPHACNSLIPLAITRIILIWFWYTSSS
jgi:hypothetical protein